MKITKLEEANRNPHLRSNPQQTTQHTTHNTQHTTHMGGPEAKTYMGWWGHLGGPKQKGIISYSVSPYAQKPMIHSFQNSYKNSFRRFKSQFLFVLIPGALYYMWWTNGKAYNAFLYTKAGREELERVNG